MEPFFFTSYGESGGDRGHVGRFHSDLQDEIFRRMGREPRFGGELRRVADPANPPGLPAAVLSCRVMVVLCSEPYFDSVQCGLEWAVFGERLRRGGEPAHGTATGAAALVTVAWAAASARPPVDVESAESYRACIDEYGPDGVFALMRDPEASDSYRALITRLAELVIAGAGQAPPPIPASEAARLSPTFGRARNGGAAPSFAGPTANSGVGLVLAVAEPAELPDKRRRRDFYGWEPSQWQPFLPVTESTALMISRAALIEQEFYDTACFKLTDDFTGRSRPGSGQVGRDRVIVLIIDPWIVEVESYRTVLRRLDAMISAEPWFAGRITVVNPADEETFRRREALSAGFLDAVMGGADDAMAVPQRWWEAQNPRELGARVTIAVVRAQNALMAGSRWGGRGAWLSARNTRKPLLRIIPDEEPEA